jgi:hypothetical protein
MVMPSGADGRGPRVTPFRRLAHARQRTHGRRMGLSSAPPCCRVAGRTSVLTAPLPSSRSAAMMAQLTFGRSSRRMRTCREPRHRVELSVAPSEHWSRRCTITSSFGQQQADLEGETAEHTPITMWAADTGHGEGMWPTILGPLHKLVDGLYEASIRSLLSDPFIHAHASGRRALTGVAESSGSRVAAFGPCS